MKDNKKTIIVLLVIIVVLVAVIAYLLLNNADKNTNTTTSQNAVSEEYVVMNRTTNSTLVPAYKDRYANLTSEQINEMVEKRSMDKVSVAIKDGTLTKEGATIVITDNNDFPYSYGEDYNLQKLENGEWKDVQQIGPYNINDIACEVKEDRTAEMQLNWKNIYGELEAGHYKLNLAVSQNDSSNATVSTEFDIE